MFKRTAAQVLLLLLLITGMGSKVSDTMLDFKERRFLVKHLKDTRTTFLESIKGLNEAQLNFKPAPDKWSIQECVVHLALSEKGLWNWAEGVLKSPANPEKRKEIRLTDEQLLAAVADRTNKAQASENLLPQSATWKTAADAVDDFKKSRNSLIKYVNTTTEDMRSHVTASAAGVIDTYQVLLLISAHTTRHTRQIQEIKASPAYPR
jgi:hypothetical protein